MARSLPVSVVAAAMPGYRDFQLVRATSSSTVYSAVVSQSTESTTENDKKVAINLIASTDEHGRFGAPSRAQMQALKMNFDTLKIAEQRGVQHFIRPIELKQIRVDHATLTSLTSSSSVSNQVANQSTDPFNALVMISHWSPGQLLSKLAAAPRYADGFPLCEVLSIALQLCSTLTTIHQDAVIRRGFSTENILYDPMTGAITMLDFGLPTASAFDDSCCPPQAEQSAEDVHDSSYGTSSEDEDTYISPSLRYEKLNERSIGENDGQTLACSSPLLLLPHSSIASSHWKHRSNFLWRCFLAPETGKLFSKTDPRNDIWSLGVTLYALLTGRLPFISLSVADALELSHIVLTRNTPSVNNIRPHLPFMLSEITAKCLQKKPADRYQSAQGIMSDLCRVYQQVIAFAHTQHLKRSVISPTVSSTLLPPSSPHAHVSTPPTLNLFAKQMEHELELERAFSPLSEECKLTIQSQTESAPSTRTSSVYQFCTGKSLLPTDEELGITNNSTHPEVFTQFVCGREDAPSKLFWSDLLYGVQAQWKILFDALVSVLLHGGCRMIVIHGVAGAGKSGLAREMLNDITSKYRNCLVLKSHLDVQTSPFGMWRSSINDLVFNIFQQPGSAVTQWRSRIQAALGSVGSMVTELFPVLTRLIGKQSSKPQGAHTQGHVTSALLAMLSAFCLGAKRPLLFLFDDIQRADPSSLSLLEAFVKSPRSQHVGVIVTYRSEDVSEQHPLTKFLAGLASTNVPMTDIEIPPLSPQDISEMIVDTLHTTPDKALPIAEHLFSKSRGNPFYVRQLLLQMHRDHRLVFRVFSPASAIRHLHKSNDVAVGEWRLASPASLARSLSISGSPRSDSHWSEQTASDIKSLIQADIKRLEHHTLLALAACLGSHIIVSDLFLVSEFKTENDVLEVLLEACQHNLLEMSQVSDPDSLFLDSTSPTPASSSPQNHIADFSPVFTFTHDLVQQACFALIPPGDVDSVHLKIANGFFQRAKKSQTFMVSHRFRIAGHIVSGFRALNVRTKESREWAFFLYETAKEAHILSSYVLGLQYATVAEILLGLEEPDLGTTSSTSSTAVILSKRSPFYEEVWSQDPQFARDLTYKRAQLEYCNARYEQSEKRLLASLGQIDDDLSKVDFFVGLQEVYVSSGRFAEAARVNREALGLLDFSLPRLSTESFSSDSETLKTEFDDAYHLGNKICDEELVWKLSEEFQKRLQGRAISSLIDTLPPCEDKRLLAIGSLLASILPSFYLNSRSLAEAVCLVVAIMMLEHGIQGSSCQPIAQLGAFYLQNADLVRKHLPADLGELGATIGRQYHNCEPWLECRALMVNGLILQFYKSFSCCERWIIESRYSGFENGGELFVSFSLFVQCMLRSWTLSVSEMAKYVEKCRSTNQRLANEIVTDYNLEGQMLGIRTMHDARFLDDGYSPALEPDESEYLARALALSPLACAGFQVTRARSLYILNRPNAAFEMLKDIDVAQISGVPGVIQTVLFRTLGIALVIRKRNLWDSSLEWKNEREVLLKRTIADMELIKAWSDVNPSTFLCMFNLCSAELAFANFVGRSDSAGKTIRSRQEENELVRISSQYRSSVVGFSTGLREPMAMSSSTMYTNSQLRMELTTQAEGPTESLWFIALANERAAEFMLICNRPEAATRFAMSSLRKWELYESEVKISQMLKEYSNLLSSVLNSLGVSDAIGTHHMTRTFSGRPLAQPAEPAFVRGDNSNLLNQPDINSFEEMDPSYYYDVSSSFNTGDVDLKTVIRATQAISSEIVLPKLLSLVIKNVLRVSGSERAILFSLTTQSALQEDDTQLWEVDAMLDVRSDHEVYVRPSLLAQTRDTRLGSPEPPSRDHAHADAYPHSILNFVVHSGHAIILADAYSDTTFGRDPYIQRNKIRSLLCLPLMQRGGLNSALYLDSTTAIGLFRKERLLVSKLIAAQAAISIDNSLLYERVTRYSRSLESRVAQRTYELEVASKQAQAANLAKTSFVTNLSMEVRTPMAAIFGGVDLMADPSTSSNLTDEQKEVLNIIHSSAASMLNIVSDVLDLSKIESGRVELVARPFTLREAIDSAMDVLASKCLSKGVELQSMVDLDVPHEITADSKRLTQVIFNLLSNAIKFTMQGSIYLKVSAASTEQSGSDHCYTLHFSVTDSGIGIPKAMQSKLFQPFSQVHNDSARVLTGTGLGLAISKHLVEMMNGEIWVESEEDSHHKGSTFHFTIKCLGSDDKRPAYLQREVDIQAGTVVGSSMAPRPKRDLLVVHPYPTTSEWLNETASHWNVSSVSVSTLDEASQFVANQTGSPNLFAVVVDYRALSTFRYVDAETDQPVDDAMVRSNGSPSAQSTQTRSIEKVYRRYTIDADLVRQAGELLGRCCRLSEKTTLVPKLIIVGPISLQGVIRTIFRSVNLGIYAFISTPIKLANMFQTLHDAVQSSSTAVRVSNALTSASAKSEGNKRRFCSMDLVLVVEDNAINRKILQRMLLALGFRSQQIQTAVNGQVALEALLRWVDEKMKSKSSSDSQSSQSDGSRTRVCMLLDSQMPVMTGPECARAIRQSTRIPAEYQPYIIALTANALVGDKNTCLRSGCDVHYTKPVTLEQLQQALETAAEVGHQPTSSQQEQRTS